MSKLYISLAFIFTFLISSAQNLVMNPGFEQYTTCPNYVSQINNATGWSSSYYSPDYYHACSSIMGVPLNSSGFQYPASGQAYAGGFCFGAGSKNYIYPDVREWLTGTLIQPLTTGVKYYVSFKVALSNNSSFAVDKLGARFLLAPGQLGFQNNADVFTSATIVDTLNWTRIIGSFIADSNYTYISLGNHFADSLTDTLRLRPIINNSFNAYYVFDDVCVSTDSLLSANFATSITEEKIKPKSLYPNPCRDKITITIPDEQTYEIHLFDVFSIEVMKQTFQRSVELDTSTLPEGVYFYQIMDSSGRESAFGKVLKE